MRKLVILAALVAPFTVAVANSSESKPECVNVGTPNEGWMFKGEMVSQEQCSKKVLVCGGVGQSFEHYWAVNLSKPEQVVQVRCSQVPESEQPPVCQPDGWVFQNRLIHAECEGKLLRCENVGTPTEGWRSYGVNEISFLGFANCSQ